jgi:hypothetical protein
MNRLVISMLLTVWVLGGCATPFQKIKGGRVYLYLKDTGSQTAFFASSLDGFRRHPLTQHTKSAWRISLPADQEFTYFYVLDNQPFIPDCPYKEKDDFGFENCIFTPDL